jgi:hypothetical protein
LADSFSDENHRKEKAERIQKEREKVGELKKDEREARRLAEETKQRLAVERIGTIYYS